MVARYIKWLTVVGLAFLMVGTLMLVGISSVIELWQSNKDQHNYLPVLLTPLVGGICALVCYLFYDLSMSFIKGNGGSDLRSLEEPFYKRVEEKQRNR